MEIHFGKKRMTPKKDDSENKMPAARHKEPNSMNGTLVKCTYEGLPFEFPEWDDLFVVGTIPTDIWDKIRKRHKEIMRYPNWVCEDLIDTTITALVEAGCTVYNFAQSQTFPAIVEDNTCALCHNIIPKGDTLVISDSTGDAVFCSASCLYEAITQRNQPCRIVHISPQTLAITVECPSCKHQSEINNGNWMFDGAYVIPGENGFVFTIVICPDCGDRSVLIVPMPKNSDLKLIQQTLKVSIDLENTLRKGQTIRQTKEVPKPNKDGEGNEQ